MMPHISTYLPLSYRDPSARKIAEAVDASIAATNAAHRGGYYTDANYFADRAAEAARFAISAHATAALVYAGKEGKPTSVAISASARRESRAAGAVISAEAAAEAAATHAATLFSKLAEVHGQHDIDGWSEELGLLHHVLRVDGKLRIFEQRIMSHFKVSEKLIDILCDHEQGTEHEESEVDLEWRARVLATAVIEGNAAAAADHAATMFSDIAIMHGDRLVEIGGNELAGSKPRDAARAAVSKAYEDCPNDMGFHEFVRTNENGKAARARAATIARAQAKSHYAFQRSNAAARVLATAKDAAASIVESSVDDFLPAKPNEPADIDSAE